MDTAVHLHELTLLHTDDGVTTGHAMCYGCRRVWRLIDWEKDTDLPPGLRKPANVIMDMTHGPILGPKDLLYMPTDLVMGK